MRFNEYKSSSHWMKKAEPSGVAGTILAVAILVLAIGGDIVTNCI